mgnify:CR=1 FL=1
MKIGILGGSFNPPHIGHLQISKIAKKIKKLKYIIWVVTKKNPFKSKYKLSIEERLKYSKKIIEGQKFIKVEFLEKKIKSNKTVDLIKFIKKINSSNKIYFIMGADNLINFHKWKKWKQILEMCKILVFDRNKYKYKSLNSKSAKYMNKNNWEFIKFKKINISSSQIRKI